LIHKIDWAKSSFPKANTGDKSRYWLLWIMLLGNKPMKPLMNY
jgi:hypothetical protein